MNSLTYLSFLSAFGENAPKEEFDAVDMLNDITGASIPAPLKALKQATVRFNDVCEKADIKNTVLGYLNIK